MCQDPGQLRGAGAGRLASVSPRARPVSLCRTAKSQIGKNCIDPTFRYHANFYATTDHLIFWPRWEVRRTMSSVDPIVRVRGIHKYFTRGAERVDVLQDLSLEVQTGEFLALMGPSGS